MMPVRRLDRVERLGECGVLQFCDEHGRHAVERGAPFGRHRLQYRMGVEALGWQDHGRAVRDAAKRPEHHAEAMVHRHRDAQPVLLA